MQVNIKRKLIAALELPKDIILNFPNIYILGNEEITITNHKGIAGYTDSQIRIKTAIGMYKINGRKLIIKKISKENISIEGKIESLESPLSEVSER